MNHPSGENVNHFHCIVAEGGDEQPFPFGVARKMIEPASHAGHGNPLFQLQREVATNHLLRDFTYAIPCGFSNPGRLLTHFRLQINDFYGAILESGNE